MNRKEHILVNRHNNYCISVTKARSNIDIALLVRFSLKSCRVTSGSHQFSVLRGGGQEFCPK